jgi:hypothetical protein
VNRVPNPLDGESDVFVSSDSEGYVETEVEWFDDAQLAENGKRFTSKMSETLAHEVRFSHFFLSPYTNSEFVEATLV